MEYMLNKIKERRKKLGYSQKDLSKKIGISAGQYSYFENGNRNMSFPVFERLLSELGLNMILTEYKFNEEDLDNLNKLINR